MLGGRMVGIRGRRWWGSGVGGGGGDVGQVG